MDWSAYIDSYCERLLPGFWGGPLNVVSNAAFWRAAWRCWQRASRAPFPNHEQNPHEHTTRILADSWDIKGLLVTLLLIGGGSFAFHTFAVLWAAALDGVFIAIYLHFCLAV